MQGLQPRLVLSPATVDLVDWHPPDPAALSQTTGSRFRRSLASLEDSTQTPVLWETPGEGYHLR